MNSEISQRIKIIRQRCGLSIRQLAAKSGVTASMISCIERRKNSPSVATLQKILSSLDTDLGTFFGSEQGGKGGPIFQREQMRLIGDPERSYTILFPRRNDLHVEMLDEQFYPSKKRPDFERLKCDVAGYVLAGNIALEIAGQAKKTLRPGDAFYIAKGTKHRGYAINDEPARLVTVYQPCRY